jgi:hypothetical protein
VGAQTTQARVQALESELAAAAAAAAEREHYRACGDGGEAELDPEVRRACDAMTLAVDHIALRTGCSVEVEAEEAAAAAAAAAEAAEAAAAEADTRRLAAVAAWRRTAGVVGAMGAFRAAGVKAAAARAEAEAAEAAKEAEEAAAAAAEARRLAAGAAWQRTAGVVGGVAAFRAAGVKAAAVRAEAEAAEAAAAGRRSAWRRATRSMGVTRAFGVAGATRSAAEAEEKEEQEEQEEEQATCSEQLTDVMAHLHSAAAALGGADPAWVDPSAAAVPSLHATTALEQLLRRRHSVPGEPLSDVALVSALVAAAAGTAAGGNTTDELTQKRNSGWGRCSSCAQAVLQPRSAYLLHDTHAPDTPPASAAPTVRQPPPPLTWLGRGV